LNIFVGNLSFSTTNEDLSAAFAQYGSVDSAQVIMDRQTGRSRGFGFVEMPDSGEAQAAISAMNGADLQGRPLTVNEAKPRAPREDRGRW
jgi:RNA recognition motif-containing protein